MGEGKAGSEQDVPREGKAWYEVGVQFLKFGFRKPSWMGESPHQMNNVVPNPLLVEPP